MNHINTVLPHYPNTSIIAHTNPQATEEEETEGRGHEDG